MLMQQALAPDDLSAMRLLPLPELWSEDGLPALGDSDRSATAPAGLAGAAGLGGGRPGGQADGGQAWPRQFGMLLAEVLTGLRPTRQILPWLSQRGTAQLHRLLPRFSADQAPRVQRIMTSQPTPGVIEMTLIVAVGPRTRALAVRLTRAESAPPRPRLGKPAPTADPQPSGPPWLCTDIEAA